MRIPFALTSCCLALAGCVLSVDAVVPASDATFDPRLLGEWQSEGSERAALTRDGDGYAVTYADDKGKTGRFQARLGRLGTRAVLDVWPAQEDGDNPGPVAGTLIPGHLLLAVDLARDSVVAQALHPDSTEAALRAGRLRLAFSKAEDDVVLRGTTAELRSALASWTARPSAWAEPGTWRRPSRPPAPTPVDPPCFEAAPWREADALFHRDPHWVGSDVASSVDLGGGRILWLFGDSWVDTTGRAARRGARMVSNTVAIQRGADPSTATFPAYWGRAADGGPGAFVPDRGVEHLWFGHGVRVGERLLLFLARTRAAPEGLGFENLGWTAVLVENPAAEPSAWRMRALETPADPFGALLGFTAVAHDEAWVYGIGALLGASYVARWRAGAAHDGDLLHPEWWAGPLHGWVTDTSSFARRPLFEGGAPEETVHFDSASGRFLAFQTVGFPVADVSVRAAPRLTGPWSAARLLYRPPEFYRPGATVYSAKAHPELSGADLAVTYATNTSRFQDQISDTLIYYPRFVRLTRCR